MFMYAGDGEKYMRIYVHMYVCVCSMCLCGVFLYVVSGNSQVPML